MNTTKEGQNMKSISCAGCDKFIMEMPEDEAEFITAMCLDCF
jgi:hypothetical protein